MEYGWFEEMIFIVDYTVVKNGLIYRLFFVGWMFVDHNIVGRNRVV